MRILSAIAILGLLCTANAANQERESLSGIPAIYVLVEPLPSSIKEIDKQDLESTVTKELTKTGIRVISKAEYLKSGRRACLYLQVNGWATEDGNVTACITLQLKQPVLLLTGKSAFGTTWSRSGILSQPKDDIIAAIQKFSSDFATDFASENATTQSNSRNLH